MPNAETVIEYQTDRLALAAVTCMVGFTKGVFIGSSWHMAECIYSQAQFINSKVHMVSTTLCATRNEDSRLRAARPGKYHEQDRSKKGLQVLEYY